MIRTEKNATTKIEPKIRLLKIDQVEINVVVTHKVYGWLHFTMAIMKIDLGQIRS